VQAVGKSVGDGDDDAYYLAWMAAADRLAAQGEAAGKAGQRLTAHESFLRAAVFYGAAYHPLFGAPVDPRLV
jgi:hypothetical protein